MVSAVVMHDAGFDDLSAPSAWRRIALWTWRLPTSTARGGAKARCGVANLMLQKIGVP